MEPNFTPTAGIRAILFRDKTGCRSYVPGSQVELEKFVKRHPYRNEAFLLMLSFDGLCVGLENDELVIPPPPPVPRDFQFFRGKLAAAEIPGFVAFAEEYLMATSRTRGHA